MKRKRVYVYLTQGDADRLSAHAKSQGRSTSAYLRELIREEMQLEFEDERGGSRAGAGRPHQKNDPE